MDTALKPTTGIWYWKNSSKTLEFSSHNTAAHKGKREKRKSIHFQVPKIKRSEKSTADKELLSTASGSSPRLSRSSHSARSLDQTSSSSRELYKRTHGLVTLADVKNVAIQRLDVLRRQRIVSFSAVVPTQQLDDFLMALLVYLSRYLDRILMDLEPKGLVTNTSLVELKALNDVLSAQKCFAHMYCRLILGVGIPEQDPACKRGNASTALKDWKTFESFYKFCTCVAWITFHHKNLPLIQGEIGRLLHSDAFNPARRQKEDSEEHQRKSSFGKKTMFRMPKRTSSYKYRPMNDIISQRSPALVALIPSPKDQAGYLFQKHSLHPKSTSRTDENCNWIDLPPAVFPPTVGIIGEPRKNFDLDTLVSLDDEEQQAHMKGAVHFDSLGLEPVCPTDDLDSRRRTLTFSSSGSKTSNKEANKS